MLAAKKGWSVADLRAAIDSEFPKDEGEETHGRRLAEPKDLILGLPHLVRELTVLERRVPMIRNLAQAGELAGVVRGCNALIVALGKAKDELTAV